MKKKKKKKWYRNVTLNIQIAIFIFSNHFFPFYDDGMTIILANEFSWQVLGFHIPFQFFDTHPPLNLWLWGYNPTKCQFSSSNIQRK